MRFQGKVAVVTGASLGIGRSAAAGFAREGAAVAMMSRDTQRGEAALEHVREHARAAGGSDDQVLFLRTDVSQEDQVRSMVQAVLERWGSLDILVNNAGIYLQGDVLTTSFDDWQRILATNLAGAFLCTKYAAAEMARRGRGVVVNVSSEAGLVGIAGQVAYNVSKAAMIALTRSCAVDLADRGVRVNCVCPGTTDTPLVQAALSRAPDSAAARRALEQARPLNRLGTAEEIASAILYLAGDESAYATGSVLSIDGGYTAR